MPNLLKAMRLGSRLVSKPTTKQKVGFLVTLPVSIDAPLLLKALTGKVIQAYNKYQSPPPLPPPKSDGRGMQERTQNESLALHRPPPLVGSWPKWGEVYPQAALPLIDSWPNYTGTMAAGFHKSKTKKITSGKGLLVGKKLTIQRSTSSGRKCENKALSNHVIINWEKWMGIKQFMVVFFRDQISDKHRMG